MELYSESRVGKEAAQVRTVDAVGQARVQGRPMPTESLLPGNPACPSWKQPKSVGRKRGPDQNPGLQGIHIPRFRRNGSMT